MTAIQLENYILETFSGVKVLDAYSERSFFYNPDNLLPKGIYIATIKNNDGPNDKASALNRDGVFRLNIGVSKESYQKLFGTKPKRPPKGGIVDTGHDFTELNKITPHPIYAWLHWIAILNPTQHSINILKPILDETYTIVQKKYQIKIKQIAKLFPKF
jgi:Family of unknown function (DUF6194)